MTNLTVRSVLPGQSIPEKEDLHMKKIFVLLILLAGMSLLWSCGIVEPQAKAGPTVHTGATDFLEHSSQRRVADVGGESYFYPHHHQRKLGEWSSPSHQGGRRASDQSNHHKRWGQGLAWPFPDSRNVPSVLYCSPWNESDRDCRGIGVLSNDFINLILGVAL